MLLRTRVELGDSGWVEWDLDPRAFVLVGDRLLPREALVAFASDGDSPAFTVRLEVRDGVPQCREIRFLAHPDGREVRATDLRAIGQLEHLIQDAYAEIAMRVEGTTDGVTMAVMDTGDRSRRESARVVERARAASRRMINDDLLRRVAEVYMSHKEGRPRQAVARAFGVQETTASKYVQRARAAGYLAPTSSGKRSH